MEFFFVWNPHSKDKPWLKILLDQILIKNQLGHLLFKRLLHLSWDTFKKLKYIFLTLFDWGEYAFLQTKGILYPIVIISYWSMTTNYPRLVRVIIDWGLFSNSQILGCHGHGHLPPSRPSLAVSASLPTSTVHQSKFIPTFILSITVNFRFAQHQ